MTSLATASIESPVPSGAVPLAIVARVMEDWAATEQHWLSEHPAEACYAAAQARYAEAVDAIAASAAGFAVTGSQSPDPSRAREAAAIVALTGARATLDDANSQATTAVPACSTAP